MYRPSEPIGAVTSSRKLDDEMDRAGISSVFLSNKRDGCGTSGRHGRGVVMSSARESARLVSSTRTRRTET